MIFFWFLRKKKIFLLKKMFLVHIYLWCILVSFDNDKIFFGFSFYFLMGDTFWFLYFSGQL